MFSKSAVATFFLTLTFILTAEAQMTLGQPSFNGTGCPPEQVASVVSAHWGKEIAVFFKESFTLSFLRQNPSYSNRKSCSIRIPVTIAKGYSAAIVAADYLADVPALMTGRKYAMRGYYQWPGVKPYFFVARFEYPMLSGGRFAARDKLSNEHIAWTSCGGASFNMAVSMELSSNWSTETALGEDYVTFSRENGEPGIVYHIQWRACH